ncbi:hypothetical protein CAPTEDRAFT_196438 [Capitella teleta]|uniref:Fucolectin tachylectin-4 pentraxin-1 domain-containing protein n=1 Tax=Capitella teleta TaxID=283909 RepID=R7VJJ2_CAPTE|nr:hypothetical protein CAPTEDRAFT_196438 [Capitella teleta]|eukprot:ELU16546.1 hypothetical protein CAPTEDRAFT_196438 [Capitella teleta]
MTLIDDEIDLNDAPTSALLESNQMFKKRTLFKWNIQHQHADNEIQVTVSDSHPSMQCSVQRFSFFLASVISAGSCLFGDDCLFPCRCQDKEECNSNMGTCSECMDGFPKPNNKPDRFKWGGAACQTGNVAYNKRTDQSGVYGGLVSSKGVDGLLGNSSSQENCAHPDKKGVAAWFYVDLESVHQIHNVTVFNTFNAGDHLLHACLIRLAVLAVVCVITP